MAPVIRAGQDLSEVVAEAIAKHPVMVFSKSYCPFCIKVKAALKGKRIEFEAWELDLVEEAGSGIQQELVSKTGQKTVPSVFVNGKHIGIQGKKIRNWKDSYVVHNLLF